MKKRPKNTTIGSYNKDLRGGDSHTVTTAWLLGRRPLKSVNTIAIY